MKTLVILPLSIAGLLLAGFYVAYGFSSDEKKVNPELGQVKWLRDLTEIQARAKKENKPVFMLFQEVPG